MDFIHWYFSSQQLKLLDGLTVDDMMFLIPNNIKKRYGYPMDRGKTRKQKEKKKQMLLRSCVDNAIQIIDEQVEKQIQYNINNLCNIKDIPFGDTVIFSLD